MRRKIQKITSRIMIPSKHALVGDFGKECRIIHLPVALCFGGILHVCICKLPLPRRWDQKELPRQNYLTQSSISRSYVCIVGQILGKDAGFGLSSLVYRDHGNTTSHSCSPWRIWWPTLRCTWMTVSKKISNFVTLLWWFSLQVPFQVLARTARWLSYHQIDLYLCNQVQCGKSVQEPRVCLLVRSPRTHDDT